MFFDDQFNVFMYRVNIIIPAFPSENQDTKAVTPNSTILTQMSCEIHNAAAHTQDLPTRISSLEIGTTREDIQQRRPATYNYIKALRDTECHSLEPK